MAQEDFPYCVYCDQKITFLWQTEHLVRYYCRCGEVVEVDYSEGLLPDPGCYEGCF